MCTAVLVRKRGNSSTIARSPNKPSLNTATASATVALKEENTLDVTEALKWSYLYVEAVAAQEALVQPVKMVCYVYTENFSNLLETQKLQSGDDLGDRVDLLLRDSPYQVNRQ